MGIKSEKFQMTNGKRLLLFWVSLSLIQRLVFLKRRQLDRDPIVAVAQVFTGKSGQHDRNVILATAMIRFIDQSLASRRQVIPGLRHDLSDLFVPQLA